MCGKNIQLTVTPVEEGKGCVRSIRWIDPRDCLCADRLWIKCLWFRKRGCVIDISVDVSHVAVIVMSVELRRVLSPFDLTRGQDSVERNFDLSCGLWNLSVLV